MIEFPIWAVVLLAVLSAPTATALVFLAADGVIELIDALRRR